MGTNRNKSFEIRDGIIIASDSDLGHFSTGISVPTHTGKAGDLYWQGSNGSWWRLESDGNAWKQATSAGRIGVSLAFSDNNSPFLSVNGASFEKISEFLFSGTDLLGLPTLMKVIARTSATSGDIKVFDSTNSLTIVEKNITNIPDEIIDMGTLSNLPASEAIFEIQMKRTGGGSTFISALEFGFT